MALIRSQRTATEKAALRTQYGVKDVPNAMLELPLDQVSLPLFRSFGVKNI